MLKTCVYGVLYAERKFEEYERGVKVHQRDTSYSFTSAPQSSREK